MRHVDVKVDAGNGSVVPQDLDDCEDEGQIPGVGPPTGHHAEGSGGGGNRPASPRSCPQASGDRNHLR